MQARRTLATTPSATAGAGFKLANSPVTIALPVSQEASAQLRTIARPNTENKVILQLDDIQYEGPQSHHYEVFLDLPEGQTANSESPFYVGTLSFFGLKPHAMAGHPMPTTQTITRDYDVTNIIRELSSRGALDKSELSVTLVPRGLVNREQQPLPIAEGVAGTIGKVTLAAQ